MKVTQAEQLSAVEARGGSDKPSDLDAALAFDGVEANDVEGDVL